MLIPQWLQINIGYTATWAGYVTATMGFGSLTMSPVVAKLSTRYDQRALACFGLLVLGGVTFMRALWTSEADFMALAIPQILQGFAVPFFHSIVEYCSGIGIASGNSLCCWSDEFYANDGRCNRCFYVCHDVG